MIFVQVFPLPFSLKVKCCKNIFIHHTFKGTDFGIIFSKSLLRIAPILISQSPCMYSNSPLRARHNQHPLLLLYLQLTSALCNPTLKLPTCTLKIASSQGDSIISFCWASCWRATLSLTYSSRWKTGFCAR